jgi:hypothetical protein
MVVAKGWFGRRRFEVPIELLLEVDHERRRVVLARGAAPLERKGPLQRLAERGGNRPVGDPAAARPPSPEGRTVLCGAMK